MGVYGRIFIVGWFYQPTNTTRRRQLVHIKIPQNPKRPNHAEREMPEDLKLQNTNLKFPKIKMRYMPPDTPHKKAKQEAQYSKVMSNSAAHMRERWRQ